MEDYYMALAQPTPVARVVKQGSAATWERLQRPYDTEEDGADQHDPAATWERFQRA